MNTKIITLNLLVASFYGASLAVAPVLNESQEKLHQAILNNSTKQVQETITSASVAGKGDETAVWYLLRAIMSDNAEEIRRATQKLISEGKNGNAPVIWAALLEKPNAVKPLLECGAQLDANIVKYAIKIGDLKTALVIVRSGMNISNILEDCVQLCLAQANNNNLAESLELIQELINRGYNVNNAWRYQQLVNQFNAKILVLFINNGIDVNLKLTSNAQGESPLLLATGMHNKLAVETLLKAGANVNGAGRVQRHRYSSPVTPLLLAVHLNDIEMAKLLLKHGANIELGFKFRNKEITPLTIAIEKGYKQMVQLLLEQGARY